MPSNCDKTTWSAAIGNLNLAGLGITVRICTFARESSSLKSYYVKNVYGCIFTLSVECIAILFNKICLYHYIIAILQYDKVHWNLFGIGPRFVLAG